MENSNYHHENDSAAAATGTAPAISRLMAFGKACAWVIGAGLCVTAIDGFLPIASGWTYPALIGLGGAFVAYAGWRAWNNLARLGGDDGSDPSTLTAYVDSHGNVLDADGIRESDQDLFSSPTRRRD
ncbi:MAG: hypothetical protein AAGC77_01140 [Pseudomonadota bacterium]